VTQLLWTQKQDIGPAARSRFDMVYDEARARVVLFGGDIGSALANDTWEWDGVNWTQTADIGPSPRAGHALAYDSGRQRILLFGGKTATDYLGDTWEWDGESWTQVADSGPSPRERHALTFDGRRQRVILFGGAGATLPTLADTWGWNGIEWSQEQDSGPSGRIDHKIAYDSLRDRVVLFGGTEVSFSSKVVRDTGLSGVFGGTHTETVKKNVNLNDTWEYNGTLWTHVADTGPEARAAYGMAYGGKEMLLVGGRGGKLFGSTWSWNGNHWTQRQDMGPGARASFGMSYDSLRNRAVLFGGLDTKAARADTWELFERADSQVETG